MKIENYTIAYTAIITLIIGVIALIATHKTTTYQDDMERPEPPYTYVNPLMKHSTIEVN